MASYILVAKVELNEIFDPLHIAVINWHSNLK
jgi:hypothetical protein